jgi:uncharacterized cupredoxin-like copper-binding protein
MRQRRTNLSALILLLLAAIFLVACGGSETPAAEEPAAVTIQVVQNDIYFGETPDNQENPPTWTVPAGAEVTVELTNNGTLQHNWAIIEAGAEIPEPFDIETSGDIVLYDTGHIEPGSTTTATFTAPEAGEYVVICTVAGHYPLMQGRLTVTQ